MKFDIELDNGNFKNATYGDLLIMEDDSRYLIVKDTDGGDFVGVNLDTSKVTSWQTSIEKIVENEIGEKVVRIIKSENLFLGVR